MTAAITLAQSGINVLVLEARSYPHHKVCGEFLSPVCTDYLDSLGVLSTVQAVKPACISEVSVTSPRGISWNTSLPGTGIGISRYTLDQLLANHAQALGVCVHERTNVSTLHGDLRQGFTLTARSEGQEKLFHARTVIAAYGKRSNLDRTLNRSFLRKRDSFIGLKAHFYGPPLPRRIELHTFPGGYCGLSEIEDGRANVCLMVKQDVFQKVSEGSISTFISWMGQQNACLEQWLSEAEQVQQGWQSISQIPFSRKSTVEADVLMTGDAAGLIAPLAGDGMEMALRGGQMAAHFIRHFLNGDWSATTLSQRYTHEWQRTFAPRLRVARWLQTIVLNPPLAVLGLHLLNRLPGLGDFIVNHTRDTYGFYRKNRSVI